jgi:hypothetical protein
MSFRLSFHQALLGPTGAHWLDDPTDLSCQGSTRQHPVDDPLLSCKQAPVHSSHFMPALFGIGAEVASSANCGCVGVKSDEHHLAQLLGFQRDWVGAEWTIAGLAVARGKVAEYLADGVVTDLLADARVHHDLGSGMPRPICYE